LALSRDAGLRRFRQLGLANRKEGRSSVEQPRRGTVVAIFQDLAGNPRYAIEMFGHRTIQIAAEGSWSCAAVVPASPALRRSRPLRQFIPDAAIR
jgi:hypothetical protein